MNLSGFNGVSYYEPLPIRGLHMTLRGIGGGAAGGCEAVALTEETAVTARLSGDGADVEVEVAELRDFAAIVIKV
ncbi:MAG: hypothetical protein K0R57_77 [Paenibacillaceae bacterium]|nr:hypothetical protein [Paenibacillaceae bacterium]